MSTERNIEGSQETLNEVETKEDEDEGEPDMELVDETPSQLQGVETTI